VLFQQQLMQMDPNYHYQQQQVHSPPTSSPMSPGEPVNPNPFSIPIGILMSKSGQPWYYKDLQGLIRGPYTQL
jgi:hypothetical protein